MRDVVTDKQDFPMSMMMFMFTELSSVIDLFRGIHCKI